MGSNRPSLLSESHTHEVAMADAGTLHDAFWTNCATPTTRKTPTKALPKLAKAATSLDLRAAFETHLEETRGHVDRLEQVFESLDEKVRGKHCEGIAGIIEEGSPIMEEDFDDATRDACLIAAGQRAEHYEMAATERSSHGRRDGPFRSGEVAAGNPRRRKGRRQAAHLPRRERHQPGGRRRRASRGRRRNAGARRTGRFGGCGGETPFTALAISTSSGPARIYSIRRAR